MNRRDSTRSHMTLVTSWLPLLLGFLRYLFVVQLLGLLVDCLSWLSKTQNTDTNNKPNKSLQEIVICEPLTSSEQKMKSKKPNRKRLQFCRKKNTDMVYSRPKQIVNHRLWRLQATREESL